MPLIEPAATTRRTRRKTTDSRMCGHLTRDIETDRGIFARGLAVTVIEPDGPHAAIVEIVGLPRCCLTTTVPVDAVQLDEVSTK
ncbi:hypothetical protein [Rhodococcus pyridinivorans]|uniref:Uncharacterized protein n=1 Tax=Rhodococcus pyridinivorans TaxID=103816 RepID=A0A7M2XNY7_9NOCA|nr:hypothetical protein [Rhodococcus pyridinivorans]QOV99538.1 hypothetical protein INP59_03815 [Rhodococcus pyridinivorans]